MIRYQSMVGSQSSPHLWFGEYQKLVESPMKGIGHRASATLQDSVETNIFLAIFYTQELLIDSVNLLLEFIDIA